VVQGVAALQEQSRQIVLLASDLGLQHETQKVGPSSAALLRFLDDAENAARIVDADAFVHGLLSDEAGSVEHLLQGCPLHPAGDTSQRLPNREVLLCSAPIASAFARMANAPPPLVKLSKRLRESCENSEGDRIPQRL
jgi:hypothetical protein